MSDDKQPSSSETNTASAARRRPARLREVSLQSLCDFETPLQLTTLIMEASLAWLILYNRAGTLHGSISINTVLILETPDGKAQGALIDYDMPIQPHRIRGPGWRGPGLR